MATEVMTFTSDAKLWPQVAPNDEELPSMNGQYAQYQATLRLNTSSSRLTIPSPSLARRPQIVDMKPEKGDVIDSWKTRVPPQQEVCMECAMRDAEMADVDVNSPGVWERESDVWYDELMRKEREDEKLGHPPSSSRPRAKGLNLTESNLRIWLSMVVFFDLFMLGYSNVQNRIQRRHMLARQMFKPTSKHNVPF